MAKDTPDSPEDIQKEETTTTPSKPKPRKRRVKVEATADEKETTIEKPARKARVTKKTQEAQDTLTDTFTAPKSAAQNTKAQAEKAFESETVGTNYDDKLYSVLEHVLVDSLYEQKARRRWGIVFKSLTLLFLFSVLYMISSVQLPDIDSSVIDDTVTDYVATVKIQGVIGGQAFAYDVIENLDAAFADTEAKGVMLDINSPGGSPVQSGLIFDRLITLRKEYPDKKVIAVISDVGASGGYYIAAGAELIYAYSSSVVGSIGVIAGGFGFDQLIEKLGIERRLLTAGKNKGFNDPFSPENETQKQHMQSILDDIHSEFIQAVETTRADKLQNREEIFSGNVYSGNQAKTYGLIDGLGGIKDVADKYFATRELIYFTTEEKKWLSLLNSINATVAEMFSNILLSVTQKTNTLYVQ